MARRLSGLHRPAGQAIGMIQNGWYKNLRTGLEVPLTPPWKFKMDASVPQEAETVRVTDGSVEILVWMKAEASTPAEIQDKLRGSVAAKAKLLETIVNSSWMVVLMSVPMFAAYGIVYEGGYWFPVVALAAAILHFVIALVLLLVARSRITKPVFRTTIDELKKDREWLKHLDTTNQSTS